MQVYLKEIKNLDHHSPRSWFSLFSPSRRSDWGFPHHRGQQKDSQSRGESKEKAPTSLGAAAAGGCGRRWARGCAGLARGGRHLRLPGLEHRRSAQLLREGRGVASQRASPVAVRPRNRRAVAWESDSPLGSVRRRGRARRGTAPRARLQAGGGDPGAPWHGPEPPHAERAPTSQTQTRLARSDPLRLRDTPAALPRTGFLGVAVRACRRGWEKALSCKTTSGIAGKPRED